MVYFRKTLKALLYTINEQAKSLSRFPACLTTGAAGEYPELFGLEAEAEAGGDHYKHRKTTENARTELYRFMAELASGVGRTVTWRYNIIKIILSLSNTILTFTVFSTALCFLSEAVQT